ncbi:MAG: hypothetical protein EOO60_10790 [Hymenobacter sp.]|nr:MAG: hypothetical protein EOO60_10790 [Hymenobacter sp.]
MSSQLLDADAANEELQTFLFYLDDNQEAFRDSLAVQGYTLDYSLNTLPELERYIRDKGPQIAWQNKAESAAKLRLPVWSYIGETFRNVFGGGWRVSLDDPNSVNYGKWVLKGFDAVGVEFDPLRTMQAFLLRGKPPIRSMMEAHATPTPLDLSHLPTED